MAERLVACAGCSRHVRCSESACPFCGAPVSGVSTGEPEREPFRRMAAAAAVAAGVVALTGCSSGHSSTAFYGSPGILPGDVNDASSGSGDDSAPIPIYGAPSFDASVIRPRDAGDAGDAGDARPDAPGDGAAAEASGGDASRQADAEADGPEAG
jgi:hypothetical protein